MTETAGNKSWWKSTDRWLGIFGIIIGVIGVVAAFYFYYASVKEPELTYAVQPGRYEFDRPTFDSDFSFSYKGVPQNSAAISVANIAIWNKGRQSIKAGDILAPLQLSIGKSILLSVKVKKITRDICEFIALSPNHDAGGDVDGKGMFTGDFVKLNWRILEHNDGASLQIVYAGDSKQRVTISGAIEGQPQITERSALIGNNFSTIFGFSFLSGVASGVPAFVAMWIKKRRDTVSILIIAIAFIFSMALALTILTFGDTSVSPPFGW